MSFLFDASYYEVKKNGGEPCAKIAATPNERGRRARPDGLQPPVILCNSRERRVIGAAHRPFRHPHRSPALASPSAVSPFQNMAAYLGGSAIQTVGDNPVTAYRQLVQQYAKNLAGETVSPAEAAAEANAVFLKSPISASLSGLWPRLIGVLFKRVPKFGILLGYTYISGDTGEPGFAAATAASILSAPFINPVRMIEKQQRAFYKQTGAEKPIMEILSEASAKFFLPLFRGTVPLMGHSMASAILGLVGQPRLQKWVKRRSAPPGCSGSRRRTSSRRRSSRRFMSSSPTRSRASR